LASETSTALSLTRPTSHALPNVVGTTLLLEFLNGCNLTVDKVIHSSTRAVYGEGAWLKNEEVVYPNTRTLLDLKECIWNPRVESGYCERPLAANSKTTKVNPSNIYGITKLCQEQLIFTWGRSNNISTISLRLQNVYGRGQSLNNSYSGILAHFVSQMLRGGSVSIFEGGEIIRDFVNIKDVVEALLLSANWSGGANEILDIGSGSPQSIEDVALLMSQITKSPIPTIVDDFRLGDVRAAYCDPILALKTIGYESHVSIQEGLSDLIEWASRQIC
jgi:dTDP-L-rhamnose 4-epimerase